MTNDLDGFGELFDDNKDAFDDFEDFENSSGRDEQDLFDDEDDVTGSNTGRRDSEDELEFEDSDSFLDRKSLSASEDSDEDEGSSHNKKKIALFAIGVSVVVLIIGAIVANVALRARQNKVNKEIGSFEEEMLKEEIKKSKEEPEEAEEDIEETQAQGVETSTPNSNWVEIKADSSIVFEATIDSDFTVTNVRHYAEAVNSQNDKVVKSIAIGSISGLVGTYEVEIPSDKAQNLKAGTTFAIVYSMKDLGEYNIIGGIQYKR